MLDGRTSLTQEHVALTNADVVNRLIQKERVKEFPWGTDYLGALFLMNQQSGTNDLYIRSGNQWGNGKFMVHCQSVEQSKMMMSMVEIQCDKTFSRTRCREFEINGFDPISCRLVTLARFFFDEENLDAYCLVFTAFFNTAEKDTGMKVPFGHLLTDKDSPTGTRIKAILLDEHQGQIRGLAKYFQSKYPSDDLLFHVLRLVKVCRVHFLRSINKIQRTRKDDAGHKGILQLITELMM
jgi:hypothetical protein